jgi:uncharacterized membrane protein YhaH (DUF805 family)
MNMDLTTLIRVVAGLLFVLIVVALFLIPLGMIFKKAGFSPWFVLLWLIPILGPLAGGIVLWVVATSDWKIAPSPNNVSAMPPFPPQA